MSLISDMFNGIGKGADAAVQHALKELRKSLQRSVISGSVAPKYKRKAASNFDETISDAQVIATQTKANIMDDGNLDNLAAGLRGGLAEGVSSKVKSLSNEFGNF